MCGIAGIVALQESAPAPDRDLLVRMAGSLRHRGPDEFGIFRDRRAGLAHARLSIIDVATGQQPMASEDEGLWLVFNGEIFNYVELRAELVALGHRFRTQSDTEVLIHAYQQWSDGCFERFNGQWAIALWSRADRRLVLCRDRYGVRPLHYVEHAGSVRFASEIKALFADPGVPRALDSEGLAQAFTFWSPLAPRSAFAGVREVEPGHVRTYQDGRVTDRAWWTPRYEPDAGLRTAGDAADAVQAALANATSLRMLRADVPVGSYLSGGLDSSLIAALGREVVGSRFQTFSVTFEDAEFDESGHQRAVVERLGTEHHAIRISGRDIADVFPQVVAHAERPLLRTAPAPMFLLSKLVHEHGIKVVLTGEGADEMFAGYDIFREGRVRRFWARQPQSLVRPRLLERLYPYLARSPVSRSALAREFFGRDLDQAGRPGFAHGPRWSTTSTLQRLFEPSRAAAAERYDPVAELLESLPSGFPTWTPLAQDQYLECRTLMSPYLLSAQGDRMLMAHSVEGRFPFLDRDVIGLANALPDAAKLAGLDEKHVLKQVARAYLPASVVDRPKQAYRSPDAAAFFSRGEPAWVADVTSPAAIAGAGVFDPKAIAQLLGKCRTRAQAGPTSNSDNMAVVGILSTQMLHRLFVEANPAGTALPELRTSVERS